MQSYELAVGETMTVMENIAENPNNRDITTPKPRGSRQSRKPTVTENSTAVDCDVFRRWENNLMLTQSFDCIIRKNIIYRQKVRIRSLIYLCISFIEVIAVSQDCFVKRCFGLGYRKSIIDYLEFSISRITYTSQSLKACVIIVHLITRCSQS